MIRIWMIQLLSWRLKDWQLYALRQRFCCRCRGIGTGSICHEHFREMIEEHDKFKEEVLELESLGEQSL